MADPLSTTTVLPPASQQVPPVNPDDLQSTWIASPPPQGSGFSGFSGFSGSLPGVSGFSGYSGQQALAASYQSPISGPFTTTSTTPVMMGIAGFITPLGSGVIEIVASMGLYNLTAGSVTAVQLRYGTGLPAVPGGPAQGIAVGNTALSAEPFANYMECASCCAIVSGLAPGIPVWVDLSLWVAPGLPGTAAAQQISLFAHEIGIGPPGIQGISGYSGQCGFSGYSGLSGFSGQSGFSSFSGVSGYSGFSAASGISGYSGFSGYSGYSGFSGAGTSGFSGYSGASGQPGTFAASGYSGYSGPSGSTGSTGISGFSGYSAASPGASGYSGPSGFSGFSGYSAASGFSGLSGYSGFMGTGSTTQATPVDPGSTSNITGVMMGLAAIFTPAGSGVAEFIVSGDISNTTAGAGAQVQIRYGTGTPPTNGAVLTGTVVGGLSKYVPDATSNIRCPFAVSGIVTGLAIGTAYWIDVSLAIIGGGQARIQDVSVSAFELGAGRSGTSGYSGFSAVSPGTSGYSGFSGYSSVSGFSGYSGITGGAGTSGFSGYSGLTSSPPKVVTLTTSGTYTPTAGVRAINVECVGGGGAGGGCDVSHSTGCAVAGGGGGGAYASKYISSPSASYSFTIGAGGTGIAGSTGTGGGDTIFGSSVVVAKGGSGGSTQMLSAGATVVTPSLWNVNGGSAASSVGDLTADGGPGTFGVVLNGTNGVGGRGGDSHFGGGGALATGGSEGNGGPGGQYGGGGGGAVSTATSRAGGNGGNGVIRVTEYF